MDKERLHDYAHHIDEIAQRIRARAEELRAKSIIKMCDELDKEYQRLICGLDIIKENYE